MASQRWVSFSSYSLNTVFTLRRKMCCHKNSRQKICDKKKKKTKTENCKDYRIIIIITALIEFNHFLNEGCRTKSKIVQFHKGCWWIKYNVSCCVRLDGSHDGSQGIIKDKDFVDFISHDSFCDMKNNNLWLHWGKLITEDKFSRAMLC